MCISSLKSLIFRWFSTRGTLLRCCFILSHVSILSNQKGFAIHLVSTRSKKYSIRDLPDAAQRVHKNRNVISFVTNDFLVKDQLIKNATKEISNISNALLDELLVEVREHIAFLYQLSETICNIDLLLSLAKVSMNQGYVCPEFGDEIAVRQGRHPILDTMPLDIVSNDIQADPFSRLHVLAGPNMSGKSTYLRQVRFSPSWMYVVDAF